MKQMAEAEQEEFQNTVAKRLVLWYTICLGRSNRERFWLPKRQNGIIYDVAALDPNSYKLTINTVLCFRES